VTEIARQLGVAHILEGRVQKSGDDAVRVNVQLIKAANDSHLWADTYDRKLTDIFGVESEIAKRVGAACFKSQSTQVGIVSLRIVCWLNCQRLLLTTGQLRLQRVRDSQRRSLAMRRFTVDQRIESVELLYAPLV
jgi:hypothetical protein